MERPRPMEEYASDMTAARMESHQSLWKLGSCESRVWMPAKMVMFTVVLAPHGASWPLRWKQLDRLIALQQISFRPSVHHQFIMHVKKDFFLFSFSKIEGRDRFLFSRHANTGHSFSGRWPPPSFFLLWKKEEKQQSS
jgi:hypothetical protein